MLAPASERLRHAALGRGRQLRPLDVRPRDRLLPLTLGVRGLHRLHGEGVLGLREARHHHPLRLELADPGVRLDLEDEVLVLLEDAHVRAAHVRDLADRQHPGRRRRRRRDRRAARVDHHEVLDVQGQDDLDAVLGLREHLLAAELLDDDPGHLQGVEDGGQVLDREPLLQRPDLGLELHPPGGELLLELRPLGGEPLLLTSVLGEGGAVARGDLDEGVVLLGRGPHGLGVLLALLGSPLRQHDDDVAVLREGTERDLRVGVGDRTLLRRERVATAETVAHPRLLVARLRVDDLREPPLVVGGHEADRGANVVHGHSSNRAFLS